MTEEETLDNDKSVEAVLPLWVSVTRTQSVEGSSLEVIREKLRALGYEGPMLQVRADTPGQPVVGWANANSYAWRPPADLVSA